MSSPSQIRSGSECLIVGNAWAAPLLAHALGARGLTSKGLALTFPHSAEGIAVSLGNGERFETARLIFGDRVAGTLWELSRRSYSRAKRLLEELGVPFRESGTFWFPAESGEPEREEGLHFQVDEMRRALESRGLLAEPIDEVLALEGHGAFDYRLRYRRQSQIEEARASVVLIASELFPPQLIPSFQDKFLQVTLGSFLFARQGGPELSLALFHGGADFAVAEPGGWRLGSFRNLYLDKAVGIHSTADPATLTGVKRFFGGMGWIDERSQYETRLSVETLTCDGLPLAGAVPDLPGVYLITGFAGRTQNFLFGLADWIANSLTRGGALEELALFSTKRFV